MRSVLKLSTEGGFVMETGDWFGVLCTDGAGLSAKMSVWVKHEKKPCRAYGRRP